MGTIIKISGADFSNVAVGRVIPVANKVAISVDVNNDSMGYVTGGGNYDEGATVTLTAVANEGYVFVEWDDGNTNATKTFTANANKTYTAIFEIETGVSAFNKIFAESDRHYNYEGNNGDNDTLIKYHTNSPSGANANNRALIIGSKTAVENAGYELLSSTKFASDVTASSSTIIQNSHPIPVKADVKSLTISIESGYQFYAYYFFEDSVVRQGWKPTTNGDSYEFVLPADRDGLAWVWFNIKNKTTTFTDEDLQSLTFTVVANPYDAE